MLGASQDGAGVPRLDDGAVVEDGDVLAGGGGGQVVGDEEQGGGLGQAGQGGQEPEDLGSSDDVEGGGGLVGDDEDGFGGQGQGQADALALASGKAPGDTVGEGLVEPDGVEVVGGALAGLVPGASGGLGGQGDLAADCDERVQGGGVVLCDQRDAAAPGAAGSPSRLTLLASPPGAELARGSLPASASSGSMVREPSTSSEAGRVPASAAQVRDLPAPEAPTMAVRLAGARRRETPLTSVVPHERTTSDLRTIVTCKP